MIPVSRPRLVVLIFVILAMLLGLLSRVWYLQVKSNPAYAAQASSINSEKVIEIVFKDGQPVRTGDQFGLGRVVPK